MIVYIATVLISWLMLWAYEEMNSIFWWEPVPIYLVTTLIPVANIVVIGFLLLKETLYWFACQRDEGIN